MNTLEETVLDETILDETLKCRGGHGAQCTIEATHAITFCQPDIIPVCTWYAEVHLPDAVDRRPRCGGCKQHIGECWTVHPI